MAFKLTSGLLGVSLALIASAGAVAPAKADARFLDRFSGGWGGSGTVQRDVDPKPRQVTCSLEGERGNANSITLSGTCRALVVFSRSIGAELTYDPSSQRYRGVYTGSSKGPAQLSGRQRGDRLVLDITYPQEIFGDRKAVMTIASRGKEGFSMIVTDKVDGKDQQTSNFSFQSR
ncbi:hypothetical protein Sa4125_26180 [Aureimonas sp. SA4125]|uniref:hypothetical protein n=1 Tax=Aureimonas sp. SA4125 TaxID=2826993 RepID=UPI001CC6519F|nr:hypothetical protein [Aureimonas sp. SA4125]BDA85076.1 hypothetical protein Sa4125_26180 [Aureimonas sp. SA4125]